jgi:hypothetical protein
MKWIGLSFGIVAAGALIAGLVWASDLNTASKAQASDPQVDVESLLAQKTGLSVETIQRIEDAGLGVAADKAAASGVATTAEADKLRNLTFGPVLNSLADGAAQGAHVSVSDMIDGLMSGQSLAQIAAGQGVSRDDLKNSLTHVLQSELTAQQSAGVLTAAESGIVATAFSSNLDKIVDYAPHAH